MLAPLARRAALHSARTAVVLPPRGGWNTRDAFGNMPPEDAILLDNWFPRARDVVLRNGYALHSDPLEAANVVGLVSHSAGATSKLIAFSGGKAFDVSTAVPAQLALGLSPGAEVFGFNFKARSFYLNGFDAVQSYDGTTFASAGLGKDAAEAQAFDATKLTTGMGYQNRLYLGGDGNLGFWYGTVNAVTGSMLFYFPLDGVMQDGGELVAMGALTDDDGAGRNDFACFVSSKGQVALYQGTNPNDVTNWALVGVYKIGAPVNRFGIVKFGADLVFITSDGYIPLSSVLAGQAGKSKRFALSDKIVTEATDVVERHKGNLGWRTLVYPKASMLIVNIPRSAIAFDQHVMNTVTGAWCRFRNIPATSMAIFNGNAYFGSTDGKVYLLDSGNNDNGAGINGDALSAWTDYGASGRIKQFTMARPIFISDISPFLQIGFAVDFDEHKDTGSIQASASSLIGVWNQGVWDQVTWSGTAQATKEWVGLTGTGYLGSLKVNANDVKASVSWASTSVMFQPGGPR